ncbi:MULTISPECIES: hypothetical protein, partial [unclassified Frankia]|uniref:hypothetical protein n=1 Tax=unclassified Frankia TaxID=2632575 RepID=UPI002AD20B2F
RFVTIRGADRFDDLEVSHRNPRSRGDGPKIANIDAGVGALPRSNNNPGQGHFRRIKTTRLPLLLPY